MTHASDSSEQRSAERLILDGVAALVGVDLNPQRLPFPGGAQVDVDGVSGDESVLVEVFAHQGGLKGGQRHKIAGDALKLITIARDRQPRPTLILAFGDESIAKWAAGRSWLAAALVTWDIKVEVVELDADVRTGISAAQARQIMVSPPPTT